jgi:hypothetical protein
MQSRNYSIGHDRYQVINSRPLITIFKNMAANDQVKKWKLFTPNEITARFRTQGVGTVGLRQFFAAEMARISAGCASDGQGMKGTADGFHPAWQRDSGVRVQTRANGLHIFNDMVCVHFGCIQRVLTHFHCM